MHIKDSNNLCRIGKEEREQYLVDLNNIADVALVLRSLLLF
jgi:hypothetical protein